MKKIALLALAASAAAIATPAMAAAPDVIGTINITGSVAEKCSVVPVTGDGSTFTANVPMGELAAADGTLKASATLASTFGTAGGAGLSVRVVCTSANPKIAVDADPLVSTSGVVAAGYTKTVDYQANVLVNKVGGSQTYSDDTISGGGTAVALGDRLAASGNNVTVSTSNWRTATTGALLVAATDYSGKITVTITPN
jgi:hypothetical protein